MEYVAVAFRSRTQTVKIAEFLKSNGLNCEIINTPKEAGVGCGLSVKINRNALPLVKQVLLHNRVENFAGFFLVRSLGGKRFVRSIS